jgi:hypothetical protein
MADEKLVHFPQLYADAFHHGGFAGVFRRDDDRSARRKAVL